MDCAFVTCRAQADLNGIIFDRPERPALWLLDGNDNKSITLIIMGGGGTGQTDDWFRFRSFIYFRIMYRPRPSAGPDPGSRRTVGRVVFHRRTFQPGPPPPPLYRARTTRNLTRPPPPRVSPITFPEPPPPSVTSRRGKTINSLMRARYALPYHLSTSLTAAAAAAATVRTYVRDRNGDGRVCFPADRARTLIRSERCPP